MTPDELQLFMTKVWDAMVAENVGLRAGDRVINRLLYGTPEGYRPEPDLDETVAFPMPGRTAAGGWILTDEEAAEVLEASEAHLRVPYGNPLHPFPVEPEPDAPVFGGDFREISRMQMGEGDRHPLLSSCRCGSQIIRHVPEDSSWEHC